MKLSFTKMHGCGNSYLYFNCFSQSVNDPLRWPSACRMSISAWAATASS